MKSQSQTQKFLSEKREKRRLKKIAAARLHRIELAQRMNRLLYPPQTLNILRRHLPRNIYPEKKPKRKPSQFQKPFL